MKGSRTDLDDRRPLDVEHPLSPARQSKYLSLCIPPSRDGRDFLHTRHVPSPAIFECFSQVLESDEGSAVVGSSLVIRCGLQVLEEEWLQFLTARKVGGEDREEAPAALCRLVVVRRLLHHLTVELIPEGWGAVAVPEEGVDGLHFIPTATPTVVSHVLHDAEVAFHGEAIVDLIQWEKTLINWALTVLYHCHLLCPGPRARGWRSTQSESIKFKNIFFSK